MLDDVIAAKARSNKLLEGMLTERLSEFVEDVLAKGDRNACAWFFTGGPPSPAVQGHHIFGATTGPLHIHLLDLYHARTPALINYTTLTAGPDVQIAFRLFVVLDSNAVSHVRAFLRGQLAGERQEAVRGFLKFILEHEIDPSPVFYLMESIARSDPSRWQHHASDFMSAMLDLQTLDAEIFLQEDRLASSLEARRRHLAFHAAADSDRLVAQYVTGMARETVAGEEAQITRTYAGLLKAMLLRSAPGDVGDRLATLGEFMAERLGAVLGVERFAAILHWVAPERFAPLLMPLQPGVRTDRALGRARSTAWDIYLGRLPEQLGKFRPLREHPNAEATCNLYYIATGENALAELLGHRTIELLIQSRDSTRSSIVVGHNAGVLEELLTPDQLAALSDKSSVWETAIRATASQRRPIQGVELERVVKTLEEEVAAAAGRGSGSDGASCV